MKSIYGEEIITKLIGSLPKDLTGKRPEKLSVIDFIELANRLSDLI